MAANGLTPEQKERKRAYDKAYRAARKAQTREYNRKYYSENRQELLAAQHKYSASHRKEEVARAKAWVIANPEKARAIARELGRKRAKLPKPTRPCPELCECCGKPPRKNALHLDHCHETGRFRGWLCSRCNPAIGALGDNVAGLKKAIEYLEMNQGE